MSFLGAFLRGAAGPGLVDYTRRAEQRDVAAAAEARRRQEREEDFAFRREQADAQRQFQEERDAMYRRPAGALAQAAAGGAGTGGAPVVAGPADFIVGGLARHKGVDGATARQYIDHFNAGTVPEVMDPGTSIDNDFASTRRPMDREAWRAIIGRIGELMQGAPSAARSNYDQLQQGDTERARRETIEGAMTGGGPNGLTAPQGALMLGGRPLVSNEGTDAVTGAARPRSVAQSEIGENAAQARKYGEEATTEADRRRGIEGPRDRVAREREERLDRQKTIDQLQKEREEARKDFSAKGKERVADLTKRIDEKLRLNEAAPVAGPGPGPAPAPAPKAAGSALPPAPRDPAQRRVGQTYDTPRGPMVWRGNGWEAVR